MMRSMYSGVSGLRTHQIKMDVIGNNIANVNTTAFKSQRATFNEVFSQTIQSANSANAETGRGGRNPMQVGLGVNVSSIDMMMTQGAAQRTDNPFDLMIDGDGFIVVEDQSGQFFTRAGALRKDNAGNLIIPNGMKVMGWQADATGKEIIRSNVSPIQLDSPQNKTAQPQATSQVALSGNFNISDALDKDGIPTTDGIPMQIKMYDTLGNLYSMNMKATYASDTTTNPPAVTKWTIEPIKLEANTAPEVTPPGLAGDTLLTDQNGKKHYITYDATTTPITLDFDVNGNLVGDKKDLNFKIKGGTAEESFPITGASSTLGPITVDFSQITQYNAKTSIDPKTVDGRAPGEMQGYDIGADGMITAYYDNGEFKLLGQVVVTNFDNPAGLEKVGDNIYRQTANSGGFDGIGNTGIFQAGVLEMSNVDLSQEFTEMITTQRGFQANSKIISTSDEMLHELVNLKR